MHGPAQDGSPQTIVSMNDEIPSSGPRRCILVLGMHRSGTSALTRVLSLLGAALPRNILGAGAGNETGHWEPSRLVEYHDRLLAELGSSWDDWKALDLSRLTVKRRSEIKSEITNIIEAEYPEGGLFVVKDPRLCRFAPLFIEAMGDTGVTTHVVIPYRNPLEVANSLAARPTVWAADRLSVFGALLWLRHVLDAEAATRGLPRAFVSYDALLADWCDTAHRIVACIGVEWPYAPNDIADLVGEFLTPTQRHHTYTAQDLILDPAMRDWVGEAYQAIGVLLRDPEHLAALETLDRIHREFDHATPLLDRLLLDAGSAIAENRVQAAEREAAFKQEVETKLARVAADREEEVSRLTTKLANVGVREQELSTQLANAQMATAEGSKKLDALQFELARVQRDAADARAHIDALNAWLAAYENSTSWKMTAPIRALKRGQNSISGAVRSVTTAIRVGGGIRPTARKALHVLRTEGFKGIRWRMDYAEAVLSNARVEPAPLSPGSNFGSKREIGIVGDASKPLLQATPTSAVQSTGSIPDEKLIRDTGFFDIGHYRSQLDFEVPEDFNDIQHYLTDGWRAGLDPIPSFSTSGYLLRYPDVAKSGFQPLVHYIQRGRGEGRSPNPFKPRQSATPSLIRRGLSEYGPISRILNFRATNEFHLPDCSLCVQLHFYYTETADEMARALRRIQIPFTLLVSVRAGEDISFWERYWRAAVPQTTNVIVKIAPNRGRDVLPWLVLFRDEIQSHDLVLHMHTKRSPHGNELRYWRQYLLHTLLGSRAIVCQILSLFAADQRLGLVFPAYWPTLQNQPNFGQTRMLCADLAKRMNVSLDLGACPDFPAGSFFWCRTKLLKPLLDLALEPDDFPNEAGQVCGTLAHAVERFIGYLPQLTSLTAECVAIDQSFQIAPQLPKFTVGNTPADDIFLALTDGGLLSEECRIVAEKALAADPLRISVVMPTWNRSRTIASAIYSALNQSYVPYEVILCDDGSTDGTVALVRSQFSKEIDDGLLKIIELQHCGVSRARNAALALASGDLISYLDSDNTWRKDFLLVMAYAFANRPQLQTAYCDLMAHDADRREVYRKGQDYDYAELLDSNYIDLNTFVHRRSVSDISGNFDEDLNRLVDWEFIIRATRDRAPIRLPYVGVDYHLNQEKLQNITSTVPLAANLTHVRRKHRRERFNFLGHYSIGIKIPVPSETQKDEWGDYHFACALQRALQRHGHDVHLAFLPQWTDECPDEDVAIVLRGLSRFSPRREKINILWNISHPAKIELSEMLEYDHVFLATVQPSARIAATLGARASLLLQCSDPLVFYPDDDVSVPEHELLFVGNSRGTMRWMPKACVKLNLPLAVYGSGWEGLLPSEMIKGTHVPNAKLAAYYHRAKIVLNDHWPDMAQNGFVSNRIFDAGLAQSCVISDQFAGSEGFGDGLTTVSTVEQLDQKIKYLLQHPEERERSARLLRSHVLKHHTFDLRVRQILHIIDRERFARMDLESSGARVEGCLNSRT